VASVPARRLEAPGRVAELRQRLARERAALFAAAGDAARFLHQHRRLVDRCLRELWRDAGLPRSLALVAVGGYGRGELYPHSDVDVLLLLPPELDAAEQSGVERFVGRLWDVGIELGHSVRSVEQCREEAAKDVTVQTSLLEARLIAGSRALFRALHDRLHRSFDAQAFFKAKRLEQEQRHAKYQDSPYSLEPNLKDAPGGLRDLQVILWVSRASGIARDWRALAARGLVTRQEAVQLRRHADWLARVRINLHLLAGRREDRILFDYQDALARTFGSAATPTKRASEVFMQRYFRTAKAVTQLNTILLQNLGAAIFPAFDAPPAPINDRFQAVRELLDARDPAVFEREPRAILESFLLLQQHAELKGMTAPTLRALWRARHRIDGGFRRDPANRAAFLATLQQPRGVVHELRRMNQYGILGRVVPAFGKIVGQMQHDLFHVYTVDQHILMVVRNLRRCTSRRCSTTSPRGAAATTRTSAGSTPAGSAGHMASARTTPGWSSSSSSTTSRCRRWRRRRTWRTPT
jgi:[protein-PII] uridylyltransferase